MSLTEYRARRRFVASTRLDTHKSVLHDINSAHTIGTGNFIEVDEAFQRVGKRGTSGLVDDLTRSSCRRSVVEWLLEVDDMMDVMRIAMRGAYGMIGRVIRGCDMIGWMWCVFQ